MVGSGYASTEFTYHWRDESCQEWPKRSTNVEFLIRKVKRYSDPKPDQKRSKDMARIYWRHHRAGPARAWGDFTSLGYGREPLVEPGSPKRLGTTNPAIAAKVFTDRMKELEQAKVDRAVLGVEKRMTLGAFVPQHLSLRRQEATVTETWLKETGARLQSGAIRFFGADRPLLSITSREVLRFKIWLTEFPNGRGGKLSGSTQRKYLEALSGLFTAAIRERVYHGPNPIGGIVKPSESPPLDEWFEPWQTAALLESARTYRPTPPARPLPECSYALIAFVALTGCRMREAFGIEIEDVDFGRRVVRIHPNSWRRLKRLDRHAPCRSGRNSRTFCLTILASTDRG
jgi:hypothetical protein